MSNIKRLKPKTAVYRIVASSVPDITATFQYSDVGNIFTFSLNGMQLAIASSQPLFYANRVTINNCFGDCGFLYYDAVLAQWKIIKFVITTPTDIDSSAFTLSMAGADLGDVSAVLQIQLW